VRFDFFLTGDEGGYRRVIGGLQGRAAGVAAAAIEPAPFGAEDVDEGVADGAVAAGDRLGEFFGGEFRDYGQEFSLAQSL
jgi:hypothetical protein